MDVMIGLRSWKYHNWLCVFRVNGFGFESHDSLHNGITVLRTKRQAGVLVQSSLSIGSPRVTVSDPRLRYLPDGLSSASVLSLPRILPLFLPDFGSRSSASASSTGAIFPVASLEVLPLATPTIFACCFSEIRPFLSMASALAFISFLQAPYWPSRKFYRIRIPRYDRHLASVWRVTWHWRRETYPASDTSLNPARRTRISE